MKTCTIDGCNASHLAKGYCKKHYQRYKRYGNPLYTKLSRGEGNNKEEMFYNRLTKKENGCIEWNRGTNTHGYGVCKFMGEKLSHRIAWILHNKRQIPKGLYVLHKCDNPACCNHEHLFLGTLKDNSQDMINKGRGANTKGESNGMSKIKEGDVIYIREKLKNHKYGDIRRFAAKFSVSVSTIHRLNKKDTRKNV